MSPFRSAKENGDISMGRNNSKPIMRNLIRNFKDKASLIKAALSIKRAAYIHVAVIRATNHNPSSPPPDHRVSAVLSLGHGSRRTACACIAAIMDRLHTTHDAYVALKCLITIHHVITKGSFILKDQLSFCPAGSGRNFLNLSRFRDNRDTETWELSSWVRWYAGILERNLNISRILGTSPKIIGENGRNRDEITVLADSDLVRDLDCFVGIVEEICKAPDSLDYQRNDLVYEVMNFVGEDYRSSQYEIQSRLGELVDRINGLSPTESDELTRSLKKLGGCREKLSTLFGNKKRNDAFWELVEETKEKLVKAKEERERGMWLVRVGRREEEGESTRLGERVVRPSQMLRLPYGGEDWRLGVDRAHTIIAPAVA